MESTSKEEISVKRLKIIKNPWKCLILNLAYKMVKNYEEIYGIQYVNN